MTAPENIHQRQSRLIREAGLPSDSSTFDIDDNQIIERIDEAVGMYQHSVAIPDEVIREAGWVSEADHERAIDEAREEAARETRQNIWEYGCRSSLDDLARAAEAGRLEDRVSPTDLILHGPTIAAIRAAIDIIAQTIGVQEAWQA